MVKGKKMFVAIFLVFLLAASPVLAETPTPLLSEAEYHLSSVDVETEDFTGLEETPTIEESEQLFETKESPDEEESEEANEE